MKRSKSRLDAEVVRPILTAVLAALSPVHRHVVELYVIGDYPAEETVAIIRGKRHQMTRDNVYQIARRFYVEFDKACRAAGVGGPEDSSGEAAG